MDHLGAKLNRNIPERHIDLVEIASMVYIADQIARRGAHDVEQMGANWRRDLRFEISVRDPAFWSTPEVNDSLTDLLSFLSEDHYEFAFSKSSTPPIIDKYLEFGAPDGEESLDSVILFSGGIDSLGGVIERVVQDGERAVLVSHESTTKLRSRIRALRSMIDSAAEKNKPEYVTVIVNKEDLAEKDYTQRSRSFLYAALATAVARMAGLDTIQFFENGVVSLNLPLSAQIIGSRATRTTHPKVLDGMRKLFSLINESEFLVTNDFIWKTKSDVVEGIVRAGHGAMVPYSTSCTHVWQMSKSHPHCGICSQCIDRRFAVLAGGAGGFEQSSQYGVDLLVGERGKGENRIMMASYLETAQQIVRMKEAEFFSRYGEAARAIRHVGLPDEEAARQIFNLYKRHSEQVISVIDDSVAQNSSPIRSRSLPESCTVRLVQDPRPSSGSQATVVVHKSIEHQYRFNRVGDMWELWFRGKQVWLSKNIGYLYIEQLIRFPNKPFSVSDLLVQVYPEAIKIKPSKGEAKVDRVAQLAYHARLKELEAELDDANRLFDLALVDRIEREKQQLIQVIKETKFARRPKAEDRDQKLIRDRVCNAITRAIDHVSKYDSEAANHFRDAISKGSAVTYAPSRPVAWEF
ncbi:MAG: hypothetical protein H6814_10185 [Phycisphaeraceae bacterium]|nr:hypothetical protein [Phycisphaeraceae bacterium]